MVQYLDWKSINEIKSLKDEVISLNNKFETFKKELENRFNEVETKLDKLLEIISKKETNKEIPNYFWKKRRRKKGNRKRNKKGINIKSGGCRKKK